jgi:hypothetical protein
MNIQEIDNSILPPNPIRVETALSRYPVHRLAKHGDICIDINEKNEHGEIAIKWEVNYVGKFGQPGPLAYKLDTLIINRKIEESPRPIPRIIRLGSLKEIAAQLDLGGDTNLVKKALRQNASVFIIAKIDYKRADGSTKKLEADFNRYSVVFTGEELPDGRKADAVYIVLNDVYMQVLNGATTRPLDYDYLKILPPASQRFYELLSFQMYAAIKNDRARAKLLYSQLCTYAPLMRQTDWNVVRPQLARIHAPHKEHGYIGKIDFQDTVDSDGNHDYIMLYQPGPKARAEFRAFAKRGRPVMLEAGPFTADPMPRIAAPEQTALPVDAISPSPLEAELIDRGITPAIAAGLAREHGEEKIRLQIDILDSLPKKKRDKIDDDAAYLVTAIRNGHAAPKGYVSPAERQAREEARRAKERQAAEERRRKQVEETSQQERRREEDAYWAKLTPQEQAGLEAKALAAASQSTRDTYLSMKRQRLGDGYLAMIRREYIRTLLDTEAAPAKA